MSVSLGLDGVGLGAMWAARPIPRDELLRHHHEVVHQIWRGDMSRAVNPPPITLAGKTIEKAEGNAVRHVMVIEGVFSAEQKQVEEVASGEWGIGGTPLHTADVKALASGQVG